MKKVRMVKNRVLIAIVCAVSLLTVGCGKNVELDNTYDVSKTSYTSGSTNFNFFAKDLCVTDDFNFGTESTTSQVAEGAGAFNVDEEEVIYAQNIFEKLYPASTTKILTAYLIIRYGNLDDIVTVSENAGNPGRDSSVCGLRTGDQISVRNLLYGLMLESGNDAAIALAEYYSGSVEAFADAMNKEALDIGATQSHFVNPSGYPDENHYTTIYDMYLITAKAIVLEEFVKIIHTESYDVEYMDALGNKVSKTWKNTCQYINGNSTAPEGITVIGGKTGTTNAAGYCLVLYSLNKKNQDIISIVYKAGGRSDLYLLMGEILSKFAN